MVRLDKHGSVYVVRSEGPLRAETIGPIGEMIGSKLTGGVPAVIVDFSDTPLIDSRGLEWLLDLSDECCRRGGCLRLCSVGELCDDLLRITGVGSSIESFPDLTTALGSFA
ncbi:STAS domain protein [Stieleria maiorica]|uniref:STAS domain protein n=1 Tax=Stieleria maiorica TaxID=2795974 RepID=A0A5B9MGS2_9BACT|nr:STAS domain-containing protein [Stieleria maiorica]QEF99699.1 STAS domain protein [Stieleria maiorica]